MILQKRDITNSTTNSNRRHGIEKGSVFRKTNDDALLCSIQDALSMATDKGKGVALGTTYCRDFPFISLPISCLPFHI